MPLATQSGEHEDQRPQSSRATVVEVTEGATTAHVRSTIGGQVITAAITNETGRRTELAKGGSAMP